MKHQIEKQEIKNKKIFVIILLLMFFYFVQNARAEVIFEDNFDSQADWVPKKKISGYKFGICDGGSGTVPCSEIGGIPTGWTNWRNSEFWSPLDLGSPFAGVDPLSHPTIQITGDSQYNLGIGNKAYVQWNESNKWGSGGDGWGADGMLQKFLDFPEKDMKEIYVQAKLKFKPDFRWHWDVGQNAGSLKLLRIEYFQNNLARPPHKGDSPFLAFQDGNIGPAYVFNLGNKEEPYGFSAYHSNRCNPVNYDYVNYNNLSYRCIQNHTANESNMPTGLEGVKYWQQTNGNGGTYTADYPQWELGKYYRMDNYYCNESGKSSSFWNQRSTVFLSDGTPINSFEQTFGDGNWHKIKVHLVMNTNPGDEDGMEEFWIDGYKSFQITGLQWTSAYGDEKASWNLVAIGGNAYNNYADTWRSANYNTWPQGSDVIYNGFHWTALQDTQNLTDNSSPDKLPTYWIEGVFEPSAEQWYSFDDIVISTTDIPNDYVIGEPQAPASFNTSNFINLLTNWLKKESNNNSDLNSDGIINSRDLGVIMNKWN